MKTAIVNGFLITCDSGALIKRGDVVLEDGKIVFVGRSGEINKADCDTVVDAEGRSILPGLINLHDHIDRKSLRVFSRTIPFTEQSNRLMSQSPVDLAYRAAVNLMDELRAGVTGIRDFGLLGETSLAAKKALRDGVIDGPALLTSGDPIAITGGHATKWGSIEADGANEVVKATRRNISRGADVIKFMASGGLGAYPHEDPGAPELTVDELGAGVAVAHAFGRRTAAHAYSTEAIQNCIDAGIDSVEHGGFLTPDQARAMQQRSISHVPTISGLAPIAYQRILIGQKELGELILHEIIDRVSESIRYSAEAGVLIGAGTDTNGEMAEELEMIRDATQWPLQKVIDTATANAAQIADMPAGILRAGLRGDILIVDGNPLEDLDALRQPHLVITPRGMFRGQPLPAGVRRIMLGQASDPEGNLPDGTAAAE